MIFLRGITYDILDSLSGTLPPYTYLTWPGRLVVVPKTTPYHCFSDGNLLKLIFPTMCNLSTDDISKGVFVGLFHLVYVPSSPFYRPQDLRSWPQRRRVRVSTSLCLQLELLRVLGYSSGNHSGRGHQRRFIKITTPKFHSKQGNPGGEKDRILRKVPLEVYRTQIPVSDRSVKVSR